jgi:hypothetical protein
MPRKNTGKPGNVSEAKLAHVSCRVEPGMFRDELLAYIDARSPDDPNKAVKTQLLVDQRDVVDIDGRPKQNNPVSGWLRVSVVGKKGNWMEVVLPQPSQPLGETILVDSGAVREQPGDS